MKHSGNLAQSGDRDTIDLKVKHIYKDTEPPIPGELTLTLETSCII